MVADQSVAFFNTTTIVLEIIKDYVTKSTSNMTLNLTAHIDDFDESL